MSYQYRLVQPLVIRTRLVDFCRAHNALTNPSAARVVLDRQGFLATVAYVDGPEVEIVAGPRVAERAGVQGIVQAFEAVARWCEPGTYTVVDEYEREASFTVA